MMSVLPDAKDTGKRDILDTAEKFLDELQPDVPTTVSSDQEVTNPDSSKLSPAAAVGQRNRTTRTTCKLILGSVLKALEDCRSITEGRMDDAEQLDAEVIRLRSENNLLRGGVAGNDSNVLAISSLDDGLIPISESAAKFESFIPGAVSFAPGTDMIEAKKRPYRNSMKSHQSHFTHRQRADHTGAEHTFARNVFQSESDIKARVLAATLEHEYNVTMYYKETGVFQKVARSPILENCTLAVVAFNALWSAIETDYNTAVVLSEAEPIFQVVEHFFCIYFTFEWSVRLLAFRKKRDGLRDAWFVFDTVMVLLVVGETWVLSFVLAVSSPSSRAGRLGGNASLLRMLRLLRILRVARMAKLMRALPELVILVKGICVAIPSVLFTLALLLIIIYVFAILFRQLSHGNDSLEALYFSSVSRSMLTLLVMGTCPDLYEFIMNVGNQGILFALGLLFFVLMTTLTVMNMLVGVLVDVVGTVSTYEKAQLEMSYTKTQLMEVFRSECLDEDEDYKISRPEFEILLGKPKACSALTSLGVDPVALLNVSEFIFEGDAVLEFADFMETVVKMRGDNMATVRDIVDLQKHVTTMINDLQMSVDNMIIQMKKGPIKSFHAEASNARSLK